MSTEQVVEQDQTVQSEDVKAGDEQGTGTATVEETKGTGTEGVTIEDIVSDAAPKGDERLVREEGISPEAQEDINRKIGNAIRDKKIAESRVLKLEGQLKQKEIEALAPKDKPMVPLAEDYASVEDYQKGYDDYQTKLSAYNKVQDSIGAQAQTNAEHNQKNDARVHEQVEELQKKFTGDNVGAVIDSTVYGNAREAIVESEHSARIAYYLAKNPAQLAKISTLVDVGSINREIGKLEAKFENVITQTTNAPRPLNTVNDDTETAQADMYKIKDSNEWYKARQRERLRKLKEK